MLSPDTKRVARTALQIIVGLAAALPLLVHTANLPDTLPGLGTALVVAGLVTKAMAAYNEWLPPWLRLDTPTPQAARHAAPPGPPPYGPTADQVYTPVTQTPQKTLQPQDKNPDTPTTPATG